MADYYRTQAVACIAWGISPTEYDQMTDDQIEVWTDVYIELKGA